MMTNPSRTLVLVHTQVSSSKVTTDSDKRSGTKGGTRSFFCRKLLRTHLRHRHNEEDRICADEVICVAVPSHTGAITARRVHARAFATSPINGGTPKRLNGGQRSTRQQEALHHGDAELPARKQSLEHATRTPSTSSSTMP